MGEPDESYGRRTDRRLTERCPVEEAALIRALAARNQPRPPEHPVTIVNVSMRGAGVRVPADFDLVPNRIIELGIETVWSRCRVVWSRQGIGPETVGGVEFVEARPEFVDALLQWLDREARPPSGSAATPADGALQAGRRSSRARLGAPESPVGER